MANKIISVDIGSYLTKVLEADLNKDVLEIVTLESFRTPSQDGELPAGIFFEQLYKIIPQEKIKSANLAISVPASALNFTFLDLPKIPKDELESVVKREARRKILPQPQENDIFDSVKIGEKKVDNLPQLNILSGVASRSIVTKYLSFFRQQEITPSYIGATPLALEKYFYEVKSPAAKNLAFIDIGFKNTSIIIFNKNDIALIRNIPFACNNFIESIAKKTSVDFWKAEELFLSEKVSADLMQDNWNYLLAELRRSFSYYKDISGGQRIEAAIFSGGLVVLKGTVEFLRQHMGGELEIFELKPDKYLLADKFSSADLVTRGPLFATALGLAFCLKPTKKPVLNFLPSEIPRQRKVKKMQLLSLRALILIMLSVAILNVFIWLRIGLLKRAEAEARRLLSAPDLGEIISKAKEIKTVLNTLEKEKTLVDKLSRNQIEWVKLFTVLSDNIPANAYLKTASVKYGQSTGQDKMLPAIGTPQSKAKSPAKKEITLKLSGRITLDYEEAKQQLNLFRKAILDSGLFSSVNLEPLKLEDIVIQDVSGRKALTQVKEREFNLEAILKTK